MEELVNSGRVVVPGDDVRVQGRLNVRKGPTGLGDPADTLVGVVLDVETTGRDANLGAVIELAIRRFRFDREGVITHIDRSYSWREDPGVPIPPEIIELTGLTDADVAGHRIDDEVAVDLLRSSAIVIAHHAGFDRRWVEGRLEGAGGLDWGCSMTQIDWRRRGFDGQALGYLLRQVGWFHEGHRAGVDVDAVIELLRHRFSDGRTALSVLVEQAALPSWIIHATGAAFDVKDLLKERGYRWDSDRKTWWREVADDARIGEEFWLAANVYAVSARPKTLGPAVEKITAATRFLS